MGITLQNPIYQTENSHDEMKETLEFEISIHQSSKATLLINMHKILQLPVLLWLVD